MSLIIREEREACVELTLNRVDQHNALSLELVDELQKQLDIETQNSKNFKTRCLILKSSSSKAFCAGADLKERLKMTPDEVLKTLDKLNNLMNTLENMPCPTFAIIEGVAFGGGLELALACDFRFANNRAEIGLTETRLAIIPGAGGTQRLTDIVGRTKSKELIFRAKKIKSEEALTLGIFSYIGENPLEEARKWIGDIFEAGPMAIVEAKKAINSSRGLKIEAGLELERSSYKAVLKSEDRMEALRAFSEKRKAKYLGK